LIHGDIVYNYLFFLDFLQFLYGAHEALIVKPLILDLHCLYENLRGNLNTFLSFFRTHFFIFGFLYDLQQSIIQYIKKIDL